MPHPYPSDVRLLLVEKKGSEIFGEQQCGGAPVGLGDNPEPPSGHPLRGEDPEAVPYGDDLILTSILRQHVSPISRAVSLKERGHEVLVRALEQGKSPQRGYEVGPSMCPVKCVN